MIIWQKPAEPPAIISRKIGNCFLKPEWVQSINVPWNHSNFTLWWIYPCSTAKWYLKKSLAANFIAFSGVMRRIFTPEPEVRGRFQSFGKISLLKMKRKLLRTFVHSKISFISVCFSETVQPLKYNIKNKYFKVESFIFKIMTIEHFDWTWTRAGN